MSPKVLFDFPLFFPGRALDLPNCYMLAVPGHLCSTSDTANVRLSVSSFMLARDAMFHLVHNSFIEFAGSTFTKLHIIVPVFK